MKSFQQLTGTTTVGANPGSFVDLSQNNSANNVALAKVLINTQHRYYLQKYFDNERTLTLQTVGPMSLTLTGGLTLGAVSASLSVAWAYATCTQLVTFSNGNQRTVSFTKSLATITWSDPLSSVVTAAISTIGLQAYPIPANVSKIKNNTITVGQLVYTPAPVQSIQEWTTLNALPYTSDIPAYFFIYQNKVNFWPIPSTTGSIVTFNYQTRVADMTYADYSTGTVGTDVGSTTLLGTSTSWNSTGAFPLTTDLSYANLMISVTPPKGDGLWYPIQSFTSDTFMRLNLPIVNNPVNTGASYVIGQFPLLQEDFHDLLVYSSLEIYYNSIVKDKEKYQMYKDLTKDRENLMKAYLGSKSVNVNLGDSPISSNPNLFIYSNGN